MLAKWVLLVTGEVDWSADANFGKGYSCCGLAFTTTGGRGYGGSAGQESGIPAEKRRISEKE
jgi:hypothetical protein